MRLRLVLEGHDAQDRFWLAPDRYRAFIGGIGSGKTMAGCVEILRQPAGSKGVVLAPTYPMLRDATLRSFLDLTEPHGLIAHHNGSRLETRLVNGTAILWRSADNPDRLRGPNLGWAWIDEAAYCDAETWRIVMGRLRLSPGRAWITTTPRGKGWLHEIFASTKPDHALIQSRTDDNPYLPPDFIKAVRAQYDGQFARQELDGQFIDWSGGLIRREWFAVVDAAALPSGLRWVRAWDLATSSKTSADESAGILAALDQRSGVVFLARPVAGRWEGPDALNVVAQTALADGTQVEVGVEAVASQIHAVQHLQRDPRLVAHFIKALRPLGDKVSAAHPWAARASAGRVKLVAGYDWSAWLDQWCAFPGGQHDDRVDAVSRAVEMLAANDGGWLTSMIGGWK